MESITIIYIVIIALLIVCSAFFSMSETVFTSANQFRLKKMAKDGDKKAEKVLAILKDYDKFLTTILIGNNLVNIGASSLATTALGLVFVSLASGKVSLLSTVVMTIIVLICGEITPKTVAKRNPEKYAIRVCGVVGVVEKLFSPVSFLFTKFTGAIGRKTAGKEVVMTEDELEIMIDEIEDDGILEESESRLIKSAIRFNDTQVEEVFVPRVDVIGIDVSATPQELGERFTSTGYTRLPVYDGSIDNIIGVVYFKEFFSSMFTGVRSSIRNMMKPMKYVPETMSIADILSDFQKTKIHMAVVLDSYGGTMGIVTLEDILEELVGDIWDESDIIHPDMIPLGDGRYRVNGDANIYDVTKELGADFDPGEYDDYSVTGYVFYRLDRSPVRGDTVNVGRVTIRVTAVKGRRATECEFSVAPQESLSEEPGD